VMDKPTCEIQILVALPVLLICCSAAVTATVEYVVNEPAKPPKTASKTTLLIAKVVARVNTLPAMKEPAILASRITRRGKYRFAREQIMAPKAAARTKIIMRYHLPTWSRA